MSVLRTVVRWSLGALGIYFVAVQVDVSRVNPTGAYYLQLRKEGLSHAEAASESDRVIYPAVVLTGGIPATLWFLFSRWRPTQRRWYAVRFSFWPGACVSTALGAPTSFALIGVRPPLGIMTVTETLTGLVLIVLVLGVIWFGIGLLLWQPKPTSALATPDT